jgi:MFS family permease
MSASSLNGDPGVHSGSGRILTPGLAGIIVTGALTYLAMGMTTLTLPYRVTALGGGNLAVGLVVGSMFASAVVARPLVGRMGARVSRRWLVAGGAGLDALCFMLYGQVPSVWGLAGVRLLNGLGEAMFYTGSATLVTDLVPASRRTEGVSYYSVSVYLGTGLGPSIAVAIIHRSSQSWAFACAGVIAALAALLATRLPSPPIDARPGQRLPWVSRRAVLPGSVLAFGTAGVVAFSAYMALYARHLHMGGVQYVFLTYSGVIVLVRLLGRIHLLGLLTVARAATTAIVTGLCILAFVPSPPAVYAGTAIFASGIALQFPALMGIALRDAPDHERAHVVGTYTAFMDLSQGVSGFVLGVATATAGYAAAFGTSAVLALTGLSMLLLVTHRARVTTRPALETAPTPADPAGR